MEQEIWKDVEGYNKKYKISTTGILFNTFKGVPVKLTSRHGYLHANLYIKGNYKTYRIHRLVALAFIPNPENKKTVNHKNGIRSDNRLENLEWATHTEQQLHSYSVLKRVPVSFKGSTNPMAKKIIAIMPNGNLIPFNCQTEAAKELNVNKDVLNRVLKGKVTHTHGIKFKYAW